ncbi:MAG: hypothetical protein ACPGUE_11240 [Marinomonas sp.]
MSETKFTKAPWVVNRIIEDEFEPVEIAMDSYIEDQNCYCTAHRVTIECSDEEATANAYLISTAPEMYELLGKFKDFAIREGWEHVLINEAVELLAKARGEI